MHKEASSCWNGKRPGILEVMLLCCGITATLLAGCAPRKQVPAGQEVETGGKVETPADTVTAAKVNPWVPYVPKGYHAISGTNQFFYKNDTVRSKDSTIVFTVNPDLDTGPVEEYALGPIIIFHAYSDDVPEAVCHFISSLYVHSFSDEPVPTSEASDFAGVAENERYLTLFYTDWSYVGGIHPNYHSFYFTYDKELQKILTLSNIIEASKLAKLRKAAFTALVSMKAQWKEGLSYYDWGGYSCCEKSGANVTDQADIDATNMVLQHAALLPQGIVLSYHPYQIGSFAAGEFHALLPYSEIGDCLKIDYKGLTADDMDASRLFKLD